MKFSEGRARCKEDIAAPRADGGSFDRATVIQLAQALFKVSSFLHAQSG
jgi:hypothetical protein